MITPLWATIAIIATALFLLIVIPLLDGSRRFGKYISLRYTLVVVGLTMALGCVLDFSFLIESSRNIVLCGGFALTGLFVVFRSLEKGKLGAKLMNKKIELEVAKGDASLKTTIESETEAKEEGKSDDKDK